MRSETAAARRSKWWWPAAGAAFILLTTAPAASADSYPRQPGVDIIHYAFELSLSAETDRIDGRAAVTVEFRQPDQATLTLDLVGLTHSDVASAPNGGGDQPTGMTVESVESGGARLGYTHIDNRLILALDPAPKVDEAREFIITYHGVPADGLVIADNRHGDRTFFGDNFPDRARHWLPTIDHPYDKATCEFAITAPDGLQVIATGIQTEETILEDGRRLTRYRAATPLSTYLMVIGVAPFAVERVGEFEDIEIETWVYRQDRDAGFHDFALVEPVLAFFDGRVGDYPFDKLANVQSKTRWGGMENAGNIFYNENLITGERRFLDTITHEIAHQWFGDSVTTGDWNHVWLSEGFATYFTHVYNEFAYGRERLELGLQRDRGRIVRYARENPGIAVVDGSVEIDDILSTNTYQKGGWALHMLRREVGERAFWEGIRLYYRQFRNSNALTDDFRAAMEEASAKNLKWFFEQWVFTPGQPRLEGHWSFDEAAGRVNITIRQTQDGPVFRFPVDIGIDSREAADPASGSTSRIITVQMNEREHGFSFDIRAEPISITLDPETWLLYEAGEFTRK